MQDSIRSGFMGRAKRLLPMLAVMTIIFVFSMMPAEKSANTSGGILSVLVSFFENAANRPLSAETVDLLHTLIRKCAHITEYAVLGVTVVYAFYERISTHHIIIPLVVSALYAASDELHQVFVPGRSGEIKDILIDTAGALIGILIMNAIFRKTLGGAGNDEDIL